MRGEGNGGKAVIDVLLNSVVSVSKMIWGSSCVAMCVHDSECI